MKLLVMQLSPPSRHVSLFGPSILLNTLFSNTLNPCSSLDVRDQVSHPYIISGKLVRFEVFTTVTMKNGDF
jgi:hypothetical protein